MYAALRYYKNYEDLLTKENRQVTAGPPHSKYTDPDNQRRDRLFQSSLLTIKMTHTIMFVIHHA